MGRGDLDPRGRDEEIEIGIGDDISADIRHGTTDRESLRQRQDADIHTSDGNRDVGQRRDQR